MKHVRWVVLLAALAFGACSGEAGSRDTGSAAAAERSSADSPVLVDPPAGPDSLAPGLAHGAAGPLLTWLEPETPGSRRFRLRLARLTGDAWGAPAELAAGDDFFANWADTPSVVAVPDGSLVAHWLHKLGADTYAYGVELARSGDGGETWQPLGLLHDDATPSEHGFVSFVPAGDGVQAFWLDGRAMAGGEGSGDMQLRTARLTGAGPGPSTLLDARVCECCQTDAALTSEGPIVAYRDRGIGEIRDVAVVRAEGDGWSQPAVVHADAWQMHGCPVNGPALAARGERVALAWFSAPQGAARVRLAFSEDAGRSFGEPILVDGERPLGRLDLALGPAGEAYVSWLATVAERAEVRVLRVAAAGATGAPRVIAETAASRAAGVPRLLLDGERLIVAWVEVSEPSRLRAALLPTTGW